MSEDAAMQLLSASNDDDFERFRSLLAEHEGLINTKLPILDETPLILCIKNKRSSAIIDLLLDHKALKVDAVDGTDRNALHAAVEFHMATLHIRKFNLPLVQRLLKMGCPVKQADLDGETPLWSALLLEEEGKGASLLEAKAGIIRVLVKEGKASCLLVDPSNGTSPLINACGRGLKVAVAELVALGCVDAEQLAFRNFPERGNVSALDVAFMRGHVGIARLLLGQHSKLGAPVPKPRELFRLFLLGLGAEGGGSDGEGKKNDLVPLVEDMMKVLGVEELSTPLKPKCLAHNVVADLIMQDEEDDDSLESPMSKLLDWLVKMHPPKEEGVDEAVKGVEQMEVK